MMHLYFMSVSQAEHRTAKMCGLGGRTMQLASVSHSLLLMNRPTTTATFRSMSIC